MIANINQWVHKLNNNINNMKINNNFSRSNINSYNSTQLMFNWASDLINSKFWNLKQDLASNSKSIQIVISINSTHSLTNRIHIKSARTIQIAIPNWIDNKEAGAIKIWDTVIMINLVQMKDHLLEGNLKKEALVEYLNHKLFLLLLEHIMLEHLLSNI